MPSCPTPVIRDLPYTPSLYSQLARLIRVCKVSCFLIMPLVLLSLEMLRWSFGRPMMFVLDSTSSNRIYHRSRQQQYVNHDLCRPFCSPHWLIAHASARAGREMPERVVLAHGYKALDAQPCANRAKPSSCTRKLRRISRRCRHLR